jgi:hypothetical protein
MKHLKSFFESDNYDDIYNQLNDLINENGIDEAIEIIKYESDLKLDYNDYLIPTEAIHMHSCDRADQFAQEEDLLQTKELLELTTKHPSINKADFAKHLATQKKEGNEVYWNGLISTLISVVPEYKVLFDMQNKFDIL